MVGSRTPLKSGIVIRPRGCHSLTQIKFIEVTKRNIIQPDHEGTGFIHLEPVQPCGTRLARQRSGDFNAERHRRGDVLLQLQAVGAAYQARRSAHLELIGTRGGQVDEGRAGGGVAEARPAAGPLQAVGDAAARCGIQHQPHLLARGGIEQEPVIPRPGLDGSGIPAVEFKRADERRGVVNTDNVFSRGMELAGCRLHGDTVGARVGKHEPLKGNFHPGGRRISRGDHRASHVCDRHLRPIERGRGRPKGTSHARMHNKIVLPPGIGRELPGLTGTVRLDAASGHLVGSERVGLNRE